MCGNGHMSRFSFAPASVRTSSEKRAGVRGAVAVLGLMGAAVTSPSHAQAPSLGTAASFGVLAGSTVTNVINRNLDRDHRKSRRLAGQRGHRFSPRNRDGYDTCGRCRRTAGSIG